MKTPTVVKREVGLQPGLYLPAIGVSLQVNGRSGLGDLWPMKDGRPRPVE